MSIEQIAHNDPHLEEGLRLYNADQLFEKAGFARAKVAELEERMKRTFAAICVHNMDEGKSAAAAEKYARASKPYSDLSDEWIAAQYEFEAQQAKVKAHDLKTDIWRSINAIERAKMGLR